MWRMRVLLALAWVGSLLGACTTSAQPAPRSRLFILAGQSNMLGGIAPEIRAPPLDVYAWGDAGHWQSATEAVVGSGPALPFAQSIHARQPGPIGLLQGAVNASAITAWEPGPDSHYGACIERARAAAADGVWSRLLWVQGESDATNAPDAAPDEWAARFEAIVAAFRRDLDAPALPIVYTQLGPHTNPADMPRWADVQAQQAAVSLPHSRLVSTDGLPLEDGVHYTRVGYSELGQRLADAWLALDGAN